MIYANTLEKVQSSIIGGDAGVAAPLVRPNPRLSASALLGIYIEGYRIKLSQAVRSDYPCLAHYLGEARMSGLVADYVKKTPPHSYNLDHYPFAFCRFVAQTSENKGLMRWRNWKARLRKYLCCRKARRLIFKALAALMPKSLAA